MVDREQIRRSLTSDEKVNRAMRAIQNAGFWAIAIAVLIPVFLALQLALGSNPSMIEVAIFLFVALYLGGSGWTLINLAGDTSLTIMLVVNILLSLLMIFGILPIFMLAVSLVALFKVKTYHRWYVQYYEQ